MNSISAPSTPASKLAVPATVTPSPGTWQHPNFNDIAKRQRAATFNESNIRRLSWNGGALAAVYWLSSYIHDWIVAPLCESCSRYTYYLRIFVTLLLIFNIAKALQPLMQRTDNVIDIALSAPQRSLLGLDPNATPPATPGTQYTTPPRYLRSTTPRSGTPGSRSSSAAGSPISRKGSPSLGQQGSHSPYSPSASFFQQSVGPSKESRRYSGGFSSPMRPGATGKDSSIFGAPSTPSPLGKGASVPLNNRWLYERGRSSSGSKSIYS